MTIPELVASLAADPRPVVCLDTCVILDILRVGWREPVAELESAFRLIRATADSPPRVVVVVTDLARTEFDQNRASVLGELSGIVPEIVSRADNLLAAVTVLDPTIPAQTLSTPADFPTRLVDAAEALLSAAVTLARDSTCVDRALVRVVEKKKPATNGKIKDAIHLEHFLELSRALSPGGVPRRRAFVSSNTRDFGADKGSSSRLDPDLKANDFDPAGLEYFPRLGAAVGALRL